MRQSSALTHDDVYPDSSARPTTRSLLPIAGVAIYIATGLFYVLPSGNPQPADLILIITMMATVLGVWRRHPNEALLYLAAAMFLFWVILIQSIWYLQIGDPKFVLVTIFYTYNIFVLLFIVALSYHDFARLKIAIYWALLIAAAVQVFMLVLFPGSGEMRSTGTFNNPNQLGYWGLLILACFGLIKERQPLNLVDVGFLACGAYVVIRSLSKAASISAGFLILMIVLFCGWRRGAGLLLGCLAIIGITAEVASGGYFGVLEKFTEAEAISNLDRRLSSIGEQEDDNLMHRGYYRIFDNPELMIFGAGEGAYARIDRYGDDKEFHSTLGSLLVSYGIVGIALFFLLLFVIFLRAPLASFAYFLPLMTYGITHNGIRGSLLWFFLALVYAAPRYGRPQTSLLGWLLGRTEQRLARRGTVALTRSQR